jgi:hypothetical protein
MTDTCTDGACYNLGDDVNCIHNPDHAEIARPKADTIEEAIHISLNKLNLDIDGDQIIAVEAWGRGLFQDGWNACKQLLVKKPS